MTFYILHHFLKLKLFAPICTSRVKQRRLSLKFSCSQFHVELSHLSSVFDNHPLSRAYSRSPHLLLLSAVTSSIMDSCAIPQQPYRCPNRMFDTRCDMLWITRCSFQSPETCWPSDLSKECYSITWEAVPNIVWRSLIWTYCFWMLLSKRMIYSSLSFTVEKFCWGNGITSPCYPW